MLCYIFSSREVWEKVNLQINSNDTITFNQRKTFQFSPELSVGDEDDMVVVPNIPMLVSIFPLSCAVLLNIMLRRVLNPRAVDAVVSGSMCVIIMLEVFQVHEEWNSGRKLQVTSIFYIISGFCNLNKLQWNRQNITVISHGVWHFLKFGNVWSPRLYK
jgi:hypothetical protein